MNYISINLQWGTWNEIKIIPLTILSKGIKYIGISWLKKTLQNLYHENYKTLFKKLKTILINGKASRVHEAETLILLRWWHFPIWSTESTKLYQSLWSGNKHTCQSLAPDPELLKHLRPSEWWQRCQEHLLLNSWSLTLVPGRLLNPCPFPEWQERLLFWELTPR